MKLVYSSINDQFIDELECLLLDYHLIVELLILKKFCNFTFLYF